jgi:hypothetical protein
MMWCTTQPSTSSHASADHLVAPSTILTAFMQDLSFSPVVSRAALPGGWLSHMCFDRCVAVNESIDGDMLWRLQMLSQPVSQFERLKGRYGDLAESTTIPHTFSRSR